LPFTNVWTDFFILRAIDRHAQRPVLCRALLQAPDWWKGSPLLAQMFSAFADSRAAKGEKIDLATELVARTPESLGEFDAFLAKLETPVAERLRAQLEQWRRTRVDRDLLRSIGRVWAADAEQAVVIE